MFPRVSFEQWEYALVGILLVGNRNSQPNEVWGFVEKLPLVLVEEFLHPFRLFCQDLIDVLLVVLYYIHHPGDELKWDGWVEQIAHAVDEYPFWILPLSGNVETFLVACWLESVAVLMLDFWVWVAFHACCEGFCITVTAIFAATCYWIPCMVCPGYAGRHINLSQNALF